MSRRRLAGALAVILLSCLDAGAARAQRGPEWAGRTRPVPPQQIAGHYYVGTSDLTAYLTGAELAASERDAELLERGGRNDFAFGNTAGYPPVAVDRRLRHGDTVRVGGIVLVAHLTPGHTRGCTTWSTEVQEGGASPPFAPCRVRSCWRRTRRCWSAFTRGSPRSGRGAACARWWERRPAGGMPRESRKRWKPGCGRHATAPRFPDLEGRCGDRL